jgi:very-short-patch-repair endonuclease
MGRKPFVPDALTRGPFRVVEARQAGLERWHLEGASWRRVSRGMYVWAGIPETTIGRLAAASRRLPGAAAFSGLTAAWLHGLDVPACDPIEVTVPSGLDMSARAGMRIRRAGLDDVDVVQVRGFPATRIVRTIAEICGRLSLTEAVVVADAALHGRRVTIAELVSWADSRYGRAGTRRLRRVIEFAEPSAESPMESRLRMLLVLGGLPRPKAQVSLHDRDGRFVARPDLYYEHVRLGIEYDGSVHRSSLVEDDRRQNKLLRAGVRLLRFTAGDVLKNPTSVLAHVRDALDSPQLAPSAGLACR